MAGSKPTAPSPVALQEIFSKASRTPFHIKNQLSHRQMLCLADVWDGWALDARMTSEESARLVGWAEGLRKLAQEVGNDWSPPEPSELSVIGCLGKYVCAED